VQQGSNGDAVRAVQSQIHSRGDVANQISIDGIFGPVTNDAVRALQTLLLRIGVIDAVESPYYVADQAQFT
jgi:Putative peptidoglycan binding domain